MSLDRINQQLKKFGLSSQDDEMSVQALQFGRWIIFGDAGGDTFLVALHDDVQREFNGLAQGNAVSLSKEYFWSAKWLGNSPCFRGYDELWNFLPAEPRSVSVAVPRSSERMGIGRAKKLSKDWWLFESEAGEYGVVPVKETARWILSE